MNKLIYCKKLKKKTIGLKNPPFPNKLGFKIYKNISKKIWFKWIKYQTKLINEYNLILSNKNDYKFLINKMKKYLFK